MLSRRDFILTLAPATYLILKRILKGIYPDATEQEIQTEINRLRDEVYGKAVSTLQPTHVTETELRIRATLPKDDLNFVTLANWSPDAGELVAGELIMNDGKGGYYVIGLGIHGSIGKNGEVQNVVPLKLDYFRPSAVGAISLDSLPLAGTQLRTGDSIGEAIVINWFTHFPQILKMEQRDPELGFSRDLIISTTEAPDLTSYHIASSQQHLVDKQLAQLGIVDNQFVAGNPMMNLLGDLAELAVGEEAYDETYAGMFDAETTIQVNNPALEYIAASAQSTLGVHREFMGLDRYLGPVWLNATDPIGSGDRVEIATSNFGQADNFRDDLAELIGDQDKLALIALGLFIANQKAEDSAKMLELSEDSNATYDRRRFLLFGLALTIISGAATSNLLELLDRREDLATEIATIISQEFPDLGAFGKSRLLPNPQSPDIGNAYRGVVEGIIELPAVHDYVLRLLTRDLFSVYKQKVLEDNGFGSGSGQITLSAWGAAHTMQIGLYELNSDQLLVYIRELLNRHGQQISSLFSADDMIELYSASSYQYEDGKITEVYHHVLPQLKRLVEELQNPGRISPGIQQ